MSGYANFQTKLHYALKGDPQAQREFIANELIFHRPLCAVPSIFKCEECKSNCYRFSCKSEESSLRRI